ncbi:helix-turn-helix domain-containing protein [Nonomuraea cavernae]|nr:helix-turn-helix domain-containing protein [Nonomuraea cavernae]MCA2187776.1 helix-turn-helix domain-containing protein [Nonomuraea cavernae]
MVSTAEVPAEERFAVWREVSSKLWVPLEARCEPHLESEFRAQADFSGLGLVQAMLLTTTPLSVHRTSKLIRQSDPEVFFLNCVVHGGMRAEQDGRCADLHVGDLMLRDSSHPYLTSHAPGKSSNQVLVLQFPRSLLPLPQRDLRRLTMVPLPGAQGIGALSSHFMLQLARRLHEFTPSDTVRLSTLTLDVLIAALAGALDIHGTVSPETRRRALLAQIHAFIQQNLGDPTLTPGSVAAAHHISLRSLHKLFHTEGHTVAGWIRERRMLRCHRDLADPRLAAQSIAAIAARWGFANSAHFSQAFRSVYGLSPRQFRQQSAIVRAY